MKKVLQIIGLALCLTVIAGFLRAEDVPVNTTAVEVAQATYDIDYLSKSIKNTSNGIVCTAWVIDEIKISLSKKSVTLYAKGAVTPEDAKNGIFTTEIKTSTINDIDITTMQTFLQLYGEVAQTMVLVCPNFQGAVIKNTADLE